MICFVIGQNTTDIPEHTQESSINNLLRLPLVSPCLSAYLTLCCPMKACEAAP